ncbi:aminoglycoside phosphotransferase family protein [Streptomyces sp. Act143]|uniref:aminoglycoside phosphotransferase family protein n=1 Tax=Streptomyces sp. Act143 TaxID=2200760 RepID=UPI00215B5063|nr:aminoglycoside phosphotransferase family protein [Streptomyces sp. Act143]
MQRQTPTVVDRGTYRDAVTPWEQQEWRRAALDWIREGLAARGLRVTAERWRVRLRPWSVLVRIEVTDGADVRSVWFKANPPGSAFEGALTAALARRVPEHVLEPLAVDAGRGWSLLPHGGELFRDALERGAADIRAWEEALRQYASMQRALLPYVDELGRLGVPDARAAALPGIFDAAVAANTALEPEDRTRLHALRPRLLDWCAELAATGVPDSLDHCDLHDGQLLRPAPGRFTFFDWGDANLSHPFCSFTVPARRVRERYGPQALPRLRDAYLEPWTGDGRTLPGLRRALTLATRLGALAPTRAWTRLFPGTHLPAGDAACAEWLRGLWSAERP